MVDDAFQGSRRRRDRLFIMAQILDVARERVCKTRIMYSSNLSFAQLSDYLSLLLDLDLLEAVEASEKTLYGTTKKGLRFLVSYGKLTELLRGRKEASSLRLVKRGTRVILL